MPDHGKLAPWRFVILKGAAKDAFAERITQLADSQANPVKANAALRKLTRPPVAVAVICALKSLREMGAAAALRRRLSHLCKPVLMSTPVV